ncbi:hypothetical protein GFS31_27550 [Leptolyngbya sp. BL0902]|uniref:CHAT domain-containing protein n=1 Tax=Leptolyngbya sp. BL0902 TaxID=1115757 RepID=UPI0018E81B77|nr:CHAT domain-containing protein [Leptolyngbya sp. BL0902]QQE66059.1 hypothetical protein GFS31_27550 [Leptolyngbya sp. BL0902]
MRFLPLLSALLLPLLPAPAFAQSIIPAADGTGTLVLPNGTTYTITGGSLSRDGGNLFHSFEQFGLTANEVATFLANPSVQNILGRVVGGNASLIDGLMQVNGGANLYLINPAGILFGPNTVLNLDGSFTATSASGVGFGREWLHALEPSNYSALTGDPTAFSFTDNAGAVINSGNLAVGEGERLTLMGGSVVNLGTLEAPGGQIAVLAVPGENLVILRPVGALLGLELAPLPNGAPRLNGMSPLDIPGLLRAGEPEIATGLVANPDGTVSLVGSPLPLPTASGTAITSGTLSVAGNQGGAVQILGDRVAVVGAAVDASGSQGGGQVRIGGEYQGRGTTPTANRTFVDATSTITASAGESGNGGEVILWAEEATRFDGTITAQGGTTGGDGGFVEVSGRQTLSFNGLVDVSAPNGAIGTLLLDPTDIFIVSEFPVPDTGFGDANLPEILASDFLPTPGSISLLASNLQSQAANVVLQATNDIIIENGLSLNFVLGGGSITFTADADGDGVGDFFMDPTQSILARGNETANGRDITISGANVTVGTIRTDVAPGTLPNASNGGNITLTATNGGIEAGLLNTSVCNACTGNAGDVTISASGGVSEFPIGEFPIEFPVEFPIGIEVFRINARATRGLGGTITIRTEAGDIFLGDLVSRSTAGQAGDITVESLDGGVFFIDGNGLIDAGTGSGTGGAVRLRSTDSPIYVRGTIAADSLEAEIQTFGANGFGCGTSLVLDDTVTVTDAITLTTGAGGFVGTAALRAGAGGITITTDDLDLYGGANSVASPGELTIQPASEDRPMLLGVFDVERFIDALYLDQNALDALADGFSRITLGRPTGTGTITLDDDVTFRDPTLLTTLGTIDTQGFSLIGTDNASLTLEAGLGILAAEISTTGNAVTLVGDVDGDGDGEVRLDGPITTNGGAIRIAGSAVEGTGVVLGNAGSLNSGGGNITVNGTTTDPSVDSHGIDVEGAINSQGGAVRLTGTSTDGIGVLVRPSAPITSGGGNVTLLGTSTTGNGIEFQGTLDSQSGDITFTGTTAGTVGIQTSGRVVSGGGAIRFTGTSTGTDTVFSRGIETQDIVNSGGGNITFEGTSTNAEGILSFSPITSNGGDITFTGRGPNGGIFVTAASTLDAGTGNLVLNADDPRIVGQVRGQGTLQIAPLNPTLALTLGGTGGLGTTFLNAAELDRLGNGFSQRTIGQPGHTGAITLDRFILSSALAINGTTIFGPNQDTTWAAQPDGSVLVSGFGAPLRLNNPTTITGGTAPNTVLGTDGNDTVTPTGLNALQLGTVLFRNISVFDGLDGVDTVQGTSANDRVEEVGPNAILFSGIRFNNIEAFDGLGGLDTVIGSGLTTTVTSLGPNALGLNGVEFNNINSFDGTAGTYTVLGTEGDDTVSTPTAGAIQVNNVGFSGVAGFDGRGGTNTLLGNSGNDTVRTTGPNALTFNGLRFINLSVFDGSGGINTVLGGNASATVALLANEPNALTLNNTIFRSVSVFNGGAGNYTLLGTQGDDRFTLGGGNVLRFGGLTFRNLSALDGGSGFNTLVGTNGDDSFTLRSANGGTAQNIQFANINAINTLAGEDTVDLAGVPLEVDLTAGDGTLTINSLDGGDVVLNANVRTPGNLAIRTSDGAITQTGGQITVGRTTDLAAAGAIALTGNNDFNIVTVGRSQSLTLVDINDLVLGEIAFTDGIDITAAGNLTATRNLIQGSAPLLFAPFSLFSLFATDSRSVTVAPTGVSLTSGSALTARDITVPGGPITLQSGGPMTVGNLNTSGPVGGAVTLQSGDRIQVNTINAEGDTVGGSIAVTAATTFQALGSFLAQNGVTASLSTVGGTQGGPISLTSGTSQFSIGDATLNGTQAAITSGDVTLLPGNVVIGSQVFGEGLPGQISFTAPGEPPPPPPPPPPSPDPTPEVILDDREVILDVEETLGAGGEQPVLLTSTGQTLQDGEFSDIEAAIASEFSNHFGGTFRPARPVSLADAQNTLRDIQAQTGEVPALVYVRFNRQAFRVAGLGALELLLVPPNGDPIRVQVLSANPQAVIRAQELLRRQLTNPNLTNNRDYLAAAQQLYQWIIAPIRGELEAAGITNLSFIMDAGLRTLPLAALHDGERFLIEQYSVGLVPSLGLIDPTYVNLNRQSATMTLGGASQFLSQPPLLAARTELETLQSFWPSNTVAESNFTVAALQQTRQQAQIVHLATHAEFLRGAPDQSYIQFFDGRLSLNNMAALRWFEPTVDLVTLSACQTAMGNVQAELGFAGFALQAGARSALASLWRVSDEATAGLMPTFYQQLDQQTTKAEALRQAQLAFLRGEATIANGQIRWPGGTVPLPPSLAFSGTQDLSHPFYWAAFTIVGSPW